MIVSERNVSDALAYLAQDPHPVALARKDVTDSENRRKESFARAYLKAGNGYGGPVEARKALAEVDPDYIEAKDVEAQDIMQLEAHRSRMRAAEMLISVWQSEGANARAAERVR